MERKDAQTTDAIDATDANKNEDICVALTTPATDEKDVESSHKADNQNKTTVLEEEDSRKRKLTQQDDAEVTPTLLKKPKKGFSSYILIDDVSLIPSVVSEIRAAVRLNDTPSLAVDCEGVELSRRGKLTLVVIATRSTVYIFDVQVMGACTFNNTGGLNELLEDSSIKKIMFDCRNDSDALWHLHKVKLDGVLDLQLLEIMTRRKTTTRFIPSNQRLRHMNSRPKEYRGDYLKGYAGCLKSYVKDDSMTSIKNVGTHLLRSSQSLWEERPLTEEMIDYMCVDTIAMFQLLQAFKQLEGFNGRLSTVEEASNVYVEYFRKLESRTFDEYEQNAYIPLKIDLYLEFGSDSAGGRNMKECSECMRSFDAQFIFKRSGNCTVCQKVYSKQRSQEGNEEAWERDRDNYVDQDWVNSISNQCSMWD